MTRIHARMIRLLAAAAVAGSLSNAVAAQTSLEPSTGSTATAEDRRPALAAPIEIVGAKSLVAPAEVLSRLTGRPFREPREVLDIGIAVRAEDLAAMPDSLQPVLFIGRDAYPVHRVEYDNWDLESERPVDSDRPVATIHLLHVLVPDWRDVASGAPMLLTVLSTPRLLELTDGQPSAPVIARVLPETGGEIPRYEPEAFLALDP